MKGKSCYYRAILAIRERSLQEKNHYHKGRNIITGKEIIMAEGTR